MALTAGGPLRVMVPVVAVLGLAAGAARADGAVALREQVVSADAAFFAAVFDQCDADSVASMVAEDFEFFHDKWGQIANSKAEFVAAIRGGCERQRQGTDFKARRVLDPASVVVYPMKSYGALEIGDHAFFKVEADGTPTPTEHAKFTQLWRQESGRWLLARVLSYAHVDGPAPGASGPAQLSGDRDHE